jgi:hypothetical protein
MSTQGIKAVEGTKIRVLENGEVLELGYLGAMTEHKSSLWWGTAVAYRAMQVAAQALSTTTLWSRDNLYVVSAHPGPGVIDALDYVTKARTRDRFTCVRDNKCGMGCNSSMKFEWWVSDGERTAVVRLREDFVPWTFYELSDRLGKPETSKEDKKAFDNFKVELSARIWNAPLEESFSVEVHDRPLAVGTIPDEINVPDYWDNAAVRQNV